MANPSFTPGWHDGPAFLATPRSFISFLALGILDYRVLGTNFKDYAVIFTQLEFGDEVYNTVELYSKWGLARLLTLRLARDWAKEKGRGHSPHSGHLSEAAPSCPGRTEMASHEAIQLFTKWSRGLGFLSQQQAQLQKDRECC